MQWNYKPIIDFLTSLHTTAMILKEGIKDKPANPLYIHEHILQTQTHTDRYVHVFYICDCIWENPPSTHNYKYLF